MSAQPSDNRDRIKKLCIYAILTAVCLIFGFIESLIPTALIAPGIKLGLSNAVALLLLSFKDIKGAFLVNIARISLSALLFGSLFSFLFSASAGIISLAVSAVLGKSKSVSIIGVSIAGGVTHNIVQTFVAFLLLKKGVLFYLPVLIIAGIISGAVIGITAMIISEKSRFHFGEKPF